ncbi:DUF5677 domain-containing protein [Pseudomonas orientalis]|uniref:DUF5677 domain-containing protein n=1 Tax=Pseudomonas orientalis TaxID=76758 RepID=UPI0013DBF826
MNADEDLDKLMLLLYRCIQFTSGMSIPTGDEWKNDAQSLSVKIFRHVVSAQQVSGGVRSDAESGMDFSHVDHSSVAVITRSAIEAFLTLKYVFINDDEELSILRHKLWKLSGLNDRSKILAQTSISIEILKREAEDIDLLKKEIFSSPFFTSSSSEVRKSIKKCSWKPLGGLHTVSGEANIHQRFFSDIYNHLSGHSHASYISVTQVRDAVGYSDQVMLAGASRSMLCLIVSHLLFAYTKLFPESRRLLESDLDVYGIADKWYVQKSDHERLYGA